MFAKCVIRDVLILRKNEYDEVFVAAFGLRNCVGQCTLTRVQLENTNDIGVKECVVCSS